MQGIFHCKFAPLVYVATNSRAQEARQEASGEYNDNQCRSDGDSSSAHLYADAESTRVTSALSPSSESGVVLGGNGEVVDLTGDVWRTQMQSVTSTTTSPVKFTTSPSPRLITSASQPRVNAGVANVTVALPQPFPSSLNYGSRAGFRCSATQTTTATSCSNGMCRQKDNSFFL